MTCEHDEIDRRWAKAVYRHDLCRHQYALVHVCMKCGTWLPLGPSNDEHEVADDELVLAEMIADVHLERPPDEREERIGFHLECAVDFDAMLNLPTTAIPVPGPNGCTCGFNGDCNCRYVP